ncbi:fumarate reductase flavoprotein subunit [Natronincola peptidivorans]|uniref:Fumarate reductase flavoprotein subunit n=1 Tax=Natronincola peptidivorans TaxID=426128 RepID=A0A1I0ATY1_9FIRM|nr:FAD-dependent oxidoreductase [Natronincola peptidivorans]SES97859.1 fumarate reductase flavoprotein subunit [Natronincola peptidivorans]
MKKKIALLLVVLLMASIFVGCAKPAVQAEEEPVGASNETLTDVLVIGGGGAGLVSAITAAENGADVILVEKMPMLGGNTIISATGIAANSTKIQEEAGRPFTVQDHIDLTMEVGKDLPNLELVTVMAENANDAIEWLLSLGLEYKMHASEDHHLVPVEGHFGSLMIGAYRQEAERFDNLEIKLGTEATELIFEDGKVVGAMVKNKDGEYAIKASAVVLATGGLGNAPDVIGEYNPKYAGGTGVMSTAGITGDGIIMATAIGAGTVDMEHHMMRPLATPGYWIRETVVSDEEIGGILVNKGAVRFTNETASRWDMVPDVAAQEDGVAFVIFDADVAETSNGAAAIRNARMIEADTIEELAAELGLDPATLATTIEAYNNGEDEFGRKTMGKVTKAPFYGVKAEVASHYSMGGLAFDRNAQILDTDGNPIPGLYGAGEVLGGLYGAGRIFGNNTLDNIVFGKIAGESAATK